MINMVGLANVRNRDTKRKTRGRDNLQVLWRTGFYR